MSPLANTLSSLIIVATTFGVLMHDTQVDRAGSMALNPAHYSSFAMADAAAKSHDHVHVERVAISSEGHSTRGNLPKVPPRDDDRRYIQEKKAVLSGGDDGRRLWPSV